jgi:hypothetical protein
MTDRQDEFDGRPELIKKRAHAIIFKRLLWAMAGIYIAGSLALLGINAYQGAQTRGVLVDCTDPKGDCATEGRKQTAQLIQQLIDSNSLGDVATQRVVVLAAACAEEPAIKAETSQAKRIRLLEDCVNDQLDKDEEVK